MKPTVAVLTGDLVGSTAQTPERVDAAMQAICKAALDIADWQTPPQTPAVDTRFTRYRGDGWQIVLMRPQFALRSAVVIQGQLIAIGLESRMAIGIGGHESLGTINLADASGEAFEKSGRGLDNLGDMWRLTISGGDVQDEIIASLLGERMQKWTAAQAEAASLYLASPVKIRTLFDIGRELNISPQAVNDRLRGAGCHAIAPNLRVWENLKATNGWENKHA
jgi:hypothetical protein